VRFGLQLWRFDYPGGPTELPRQLAEAARIVDEGGAETIWLMDHFFQIDRFMAAEDPMLDGYTGLGFLAGHTGRARLGLLVTGVTYRHPGLLAKTVTTLDVLSGGRATLGIGAAWYEREHLGLGVPFPPLAERFERLEEALQIVLQMWSGQVGPYKGTHYQLAETLNQPLPLSSPRPPILIGGAGERKTLRLVARYADACNLFPQSPEYVAGKLEVLRRHCETEGRDYDSMGKTMIYQGDVSDPDRLVAELRPYAALGIDTVYFGVGQDPVPFAESLAGRVAPALAGL
jgi:F420-dependent oxidoreductase-like protein